MLSRPVRPGFPLSPCILPKDSVSRRDASTFAPYVPGVILRGVARRGLPPCPSAEACRGAILFADVSGFSSLAERLAAQPDAGAEELSRLLNAELGPLLDLVDRHGGDVLKFAGDAFLAVWADGVSDLADEVRRAAHCALEMQGDGGRASRELDLRIGIGAGDLVVMHLDATGGHREIALGGAALVQLTAIESVINPREVVLTHQAWAQLGTSGGGTRLQNGAVRLERLSAGAATTVPPRVGASESALELLRTYVPPNILPRVVAGQTEWLAELRQVTVLFIKIPGLSHTVSPETAQLHLAPIRAALERFEGSINNISSDDKGTNILAIFGLPPLAHEDDAVRATSAAITIEAALHERGVLSAIGLATGRAFCGLLGSDTRRHYAVLGAVVNRAARLMITTADGVLCDAATHDAVSDRFDFEDHPPVTAKGSSSPLEVYRPVKSLRTRRAVAPPIVGRVEEQRILREQLDRLREEGVGGLVMLEGEAGIGKSRLTQYLQDEARSLGIHVLGAAAEEIDAATAYHSWRSVFAQVFHLDVLPDLSDVRRYAVLGRLGFDARLQQLAPLLNPLLRLDLPESEYTQQMDDEVRARNTQDLLLEILENTMPGPAVLVLEDVHWFDSASWQLTRHVGERLKSLLVVMTCRPTAGGSGAGSGPPSPPLELRRIRLTPLSKVESERLIAQRIGARRLPEGLVDLIYARAEGNPFFTEELVHAVSDAGIVEEGAGPGGVDPTGPRLNALALPGSVQGVIVSRIDRLPPGPQLCLKVASVIGRQFSLKTLRSIYPIEEDTAGLEADLEQLRARDLVQLERPGLEASYRFQHAITHEATYGLLPLAQRQRLHRSVAEWYEKEHAADLSPVYPILVHHWRGAAVDEALGRYLDLAGKQALATGAYREAIDFFEQAQKRPAEALERQTDSAGRFRWAVRERQIGEAYYGLGGLAESHLHLERAIAVLDRPLPRTRAGLVAVVAVMAALQLLHLLGLPRRASRARDPGEVVEACLTYERLAELAFFLGENLQIVYNVLGSLNLAEVAGVPAQVARSYAHMSAFLDLIPVRSLARRYEKIALTLAESEEHPGARAHVYQVIGLSSVGLGQLVKAQDYLTRSADLFHSLGHRRKWIECRSLSMAAAYHRADFGYFERAAEELLAMASQSGGAQAARWFLYDRARLGVLKGRFGEALEAIDSALALRSGSVDPSDEFRFFTLKALIHLRSGEAGEAYEVAQTGIRQARSIRSLAFYTAEGFAELMEVCLTLSSRADPRFATDGRTLRREAAVAAAGLRRYARLFPVAVPAAERMGGLAAWESARPARAGRAWRRSLATAERLAMPYSEGLAHFALGSHAVGTPAEQRAHLERAVRTFERIGAEYWLGKAREALGAHDLPREARPGARALPTSVGVE